MCNPVGISHSQSYKGKDVELGVQYFAQLGLNLCLISEQIAEVAYEILDKIKDVS